MDDEEKVRRCLTLLEDLLTRLKQLDCGLQHQILSLNERILLEPDNFLKGVVDGLEV